MQNIFNVTVNCPNCGAKIERMVYNVVSEKENPGIGALIGGYDAHRSFCPNCEACIMTPYPTFYEDLENGVVFAFVKKEDVKSTRENFKVAKAEKSSVYANCKLRVFTNLENFVDAVGMHAFEYHFDEEGCREFEEHMQEVEEVLGCN